METIPPISLMINFTPNTLGCYGLKGNGLKFEWFSVLGEFRVEGQSVLWGRESFERLSTNRSISIAIPSFLPAAIRKRLTRPWCARAGFIRHSQKVPRFPNFASYQSQRATSRATHLTNWQEKLHYLPAETRKDFEDRFFYSLLSRIHISRTGKKKSASLKKNRTEKKGRWIRVIPKLISECFALDYTAIFDEGSYGLSSMSSSTRLTHNRPN